MGRPSFVFKSSSSWKGAKKREADSRAFRRLGRKGVKQHLLPGASLKAFRNKWQPTESTRGSGQIALLGQDTDLLLEVLSSTSRNRLLPFIFLSSLLLFISSALDSKSLTSHSQALQSRLPNPLGPEPCLFLAGFLQALVRASPGKKCSPP